MSTSYDLPLHASMWVDRQARTICGLTQDDEMRVTSVAADADCRQCRNILDGVPPEAEEPTDWPGVIEGIGADERTEALKSVGPLLASRGKAGGPFTVGEQRPPAVDDLVLLAEYVLNGAGGYTVLRSALKGE